MKTVLTLCLVFPVLSLAQPDRDIFAGNDNGNKNGRGNGPPADLPPQANVPDHVIDGFRQRAKVKESWVPNVKTVARGSPHFMIGGEKVNFNKLVPMDDLYVPGAVINIDDVPHPAVSSVYYDKDHPDVRVILDEDKNLFRASRLLPDGDIIDLVLLDDNESFAEFDSVVDLDLSDSVQFEADEELTPVPKLNFGRRATSFLRRTQSSVSPPNPNCATWATVSVYFAVDSDFVKDANAECTGACALASNQGRPRAAVEYVFAAVKDIYRRELCVDLVLAGMDIRTNPNSDPYRDLRLAENNQVCPSGGRQGILGRFRQHLNTVNNPSNGNAALVHLVYGDGGDPSAMTFTRGCAWLRGLCGSYGVGVSELGWRGLFTDDLIRKQILLAHEIGHNINAPHESSGNSIMFPSIGGTDVPFNANSVRHIQDCVNGRSTDGAWPCSNSCVSFKPAGSAPTQPNPPTPRPTRQPTPNPTRRPTPRPTRNPTARPTPRPVTAPPPPTPPAPTPPAPTPPTPSSSTLRITRIWIVNIDNDQDVISVSSGQSVTVPGNLFGRWNLRAETTNDVDAVTWEVNGSLESRDTKTPYSFAREFNGDFWGIPKIMNAGVQYTVRVEGWDSDTGGNKGSPFIFYLTPPSQGSSPTPPAPTAPTPPAPTPPAPTPPAPTPSSGSLQVTSIYIVDIDTDQDVTSIAAGDFYAVPSSLDGHWGIRAATSDDADAVSWYLDGVFQYKDIHTPYSYSSGEIFGNFWKSVSLPAGDHTITAEAWDQHTGGNKGSPYSFRIRGP